MMKVQVVLNLSTTSDVQICVDADDYTSSISAASNPNFVVPAVTKPVADLVVAQVASTKTATNTLRAAIAAPTSDTKTDSIRSARAILDSNLSILGNLVENIANAPTVLDINRLGIVHSAKMKTRDLPSRGAAQFKATNLDEEGSVRLTAVGSANAHLWEYTEDLINFSNRIQAEPTTSARTDLRGLTSGMKYAFYHKAIRPNSDNLWEGPVTLTVT